MTDGCGRPDVVHGPYDGFAASQDLMDATQRKHALIDPVQMDDVGLLELRQTGDVRTGIGKVDLKQMFP